MTYRVNHEDVPPAEDAGSAGDGNLKVPMRLKDFLAGVATIYDLPERERKVMPRLHPVWKKVRTKAPVARKNALLAAAAVTSVLWALATVRRAPSEFGILPEAMNGGWKSSDPRYRERAFWIKGNLIAFKTGSDSLEVTIHKITRVEQTFVGGDTLRYTMQYLVDGTPTIWNIQFIEQPRPEIRFLNQRELAWTPAPNSPWPAQ